VNVVICGGSSDGDDNNESNLIKHVLNSAVIKTWSPILVIGTLPMFVMDMIIHRVSK